MSGQKKTNKFKATEDAANAIMAQYAQARNGGNGLQRQTYGYQSQSRSTGEALGRGFREFILPMIVSAAQGWKENYDLRGNFKARGAEILEKLKRGETLSEADQDLYDRYAAKYSKDLQAMQGSQPTQTAPQAQPSALSAAAKMYAQQNLPQFENPADAVTIDPNALTGAALAQEATENAYNLANGRTDELNNLLRMFGR